MGGDEVNVKKLLAAAEEVLVDQSSVEERLDRLERYVDLFSQWQEAFDTEAVSVEEAECLNELQEQHAKVIEQVAALKSVSVSELGKFQRRAKGIMAYTDTLPRKISIAKERKG